MKTFMGLPVFLVLAVTVFHTQCQEGTGDVASIEQVATDEAATIETANNDQVTIDETANQDQVGVEEAAASYEATSDETVVKEEAVNVEKVSTIEVISSQDGAAVVAEGSTTHEAYVADCLYERPDCFCLDYQEPVCATNGCTYSSDCKRVCAEAEFAYEGPCHEDHLHADHLADLGDDE